MQKICEMLGGSFAYGLETQSSNKDVRFVFLNTEISKIIGLDRQDHLSKKSQTEDSFGFELRHALNLLRKGNTQLLELIFNQNWISISPTWQQIIDKRHRLIDLTKCYKSIKGYMYNERRLVNGERTGLLNKRANQIKEFGYSNKNAVQCLRLAWAAKILLETGTFPVNVKVTDIKTWSLLYDIKINPAHYTKSQINDLITEFEQNLDNCYKKLENEIKTTKFDEKMANQIILEAYLPLLHEQNS